MPQIKFVRCSITAKLPRKSHPEDVGYDVFADEEVCIRSGCTACVDTGLKMSMPTGWECQIRPRSGLALKNGITVINAPGTIDPNYRGLVKIALINHSREQFLITKHMKVAQFVFKQVPEVSIIEVDELDETSRGEGGFGSTGTH